ncbi:hypothetical protein FN846DRAFT_669708 [Sphaerosporella brunnea]|uniref:Uncharacterized protein n=1 Tax=Sphaerosporella brunnea TaxID=1250544 RepID=A0A5J5FB77_9PEZI|nr:hypothetical protein FN846DRAFT_669708 [Sphaerosporella brunnea]
MPVFWLAKTNVHPTSWPVWLCCWLLSYAWLCRRDRYAPARLPQWCTRLFPRGFCISSFVYSIDIPRRVDIVLIQILDHGPKVYVMAQLTLPRQLIMLPLMPAIRLFISHTPTHRHPTTHWKRSLVACGVKYDTPPYDPKLNTQLYPFSYPGRRVSSFSVWGGGVIYIEVTSSMCDGCFSASQPPHSGF